MRINDQNWNFIDVIRAFFPFQLIVAQFKYNFISILFWSVLFLVIFEKMGYNFGIPYLFLSPEYLGNVSSLSFLFFGFALGGFIMGYNTYSYVKVGAHFPFLTVINKPFLKFCINNSLIPLTFVTLYMYKVFQFQRTEELASVGTIVFYLSFFIIGNLLFMAASLIYFFRVSKKNKGYLPHSSKPISTVMHKREKWYDVFKRQKERTSIYIGKRFKLMVSRSSKHYDKALVEKVYAKNKINASIYELLTIMMFLGLGLFSKYEVFEVPAATSIVLLMTVCLMLISALISWLGKWIYPVFAITILSMNYLSTNTDLFRYESYAYGLNYEHKNKPTYSVERIKTIAEQHDLNTDTYNSYLNTLNNWKEKTGEEKPKLVIINTSGGGSRSALWTMTVLQSIDETTKGKALQHTQLITGASGGMIGASYYRALVLEEQLGRISNRFEKHYRENISKDMLNKLAFMATTNDIFIRYQSTRVNGYTYTKDRGFAFEQQLNKNTNNILNHSLSYYTSYEQNGTIPTMIFTPTIINDGRRLFICSQPTNFLTGDNNDNSILNAHENVDFQSLLDNQKSTDVRFTSVLRASATFPFVMPMITLPTSPEIQLMDAGIRDNYGGKTMMQFLNVMEEWIIENTSGVIVLQIRDTKKIFEDETYSEVAFLDKITLPFGNMYKNFPRVQDYNQDELIAIGSESFNFPMDVISFNLLQNKDEHIALSWHLTTTEKNKIYNAFYSNENQASLSRLVELLK